MGTKRIAVWVVVGCCKTSRRWIEGFAFFIHFICFQELDYGQGQV